MTEVKFPYATCNTEVQIRDHAIQCKLCKSWEHINCIKEVDRIPEGLYATLFEMQCNALGLCAQFVRERALELRNCKN